MQPLFDSSNMPAPERGGKRQRLEQLQGPVTFQQIVDRAGIRGLTDAGAVGQLQPPDMDDPRQSRRQLTADLATAAAQDSFLSSLSDALEAEDVLHKCLLPITVTVQVNYATGDSFVRMLLNMPAIQQQVATLLLHKLPEFSQTECDDGDNDSNGSSIPSLILGQLRWLEMVANAAALTGTVLEVLPVCSPSIQQQLIGFLPEVVQPQDHKTVLDQLQGMLDQDLAFMAAVLDCIGNMQLEEQLQERVLHTLLSQLPAVEVEDLPGLVKHLISSSTKKNAEEVLDKVRSGLHFACSTDPRLAVPDRKQKGAARPSSKSPEVLLVKELVWALQSNEAAATACLKLEGSLTEPAKHGCFDLLALLSLHAKGGSSRKAAEACLRKKLLEGHAAAAWISRSLQDHQASFRELWPSLMSLAESFSRAREPALAAAASQLYVDLFTGANASLERQQVLQALHGHLGSGVAGEQDVALQALSTLAVSQRALLSQYSSYLANVLDHLEGFTNSQLQSVFGMFAALTAVQPAAAAGGAGSSSSAAGGNGGTRLQDELVITLNKALAQNCPGYKRIGVVGTLALLRQAAADYELLVDADGTAAGAMKDAWVGRAESLFAHCLGHPGVLAFMMDQWSQLLEPQQGPGAGPAMRLPGCMLEWLCDKVHDVMNTSFIADYNPPAAPSQASQQRQAPQPALALDDANLTGSFWFNLDGSFSPVYLQLLLLAVSRDANKRAMLACMPPGLRLLAAVMQQQCPGNLGGIDALLGCPIVMPDAAMFTDGRWDSLPLSSKVGVLSAVLHAICWLREVVAVWAPGATAEPPLPADGSEGSVDAIVDLQKKLLMRLAQLQSLEALYKHLVTSCPAAAQQLPDMSCPLLGASGPGAGKQAARPAAAAAASKKGGAGSAGKSEAAAVTAADAMTWLRCLRLPAVCILNATQPPQYVLTTLLPAAYLAADVHSKLKLLVSRTRRPAGLAAATPAAPAAAFPGLPGLAAAGGGGVRIPGAAGAGPPCLQGVSLQELVQQLTPVLPALQQLLSTALSVLMEPPDSGRQALFEDLPGENNTSDTPLYQIPAVSEVADPVPAAHALAMACLQSFALLLGCSKELPLPLLQQVLAALVVQQVAAAADPKQQMVSLLAGAFKSCRKLTCRGGAASPQGTLQLELAVLSLMQAVAALAAHQGAPAKHLAAMARRQCEAAGSLLKESWQQQQEDEAEEGKGFTWKGQAAAITQLLTVLISRAADPSTQLLHLASEVLTEVKGSGEKLSAKDQLEAAAGYAALCPATFVTWYKVVFEQLVSCWEGLVAQALRMMPAAAAAGGGGSRANLAGSQQPGSSQGPADWDDEQVDALLVKAERCCQAFAQLFNLTKSHDKRNGLLATAVKLGGSYVDLLIKAMPFWRRLYASEHAPQFKALVRDVQRGTKLMQTICNEGKARAAAPLLSRAPAAKRSLERFVFEMKGLFHDAPDTSFHLGNLKHRDIVGNTIGSQLCPDAEEEEEDDDDDDDGYDGGADEEDAEQEAE